MKNKLGFTIPEMLLYMGILSILLFVFTGVFSTSLDIQKETAAASSVEQDGRYLLARLMYDIQRADTLVTPVNSGDTTNTMQLTIAGIVYTYSLANGNLMLANNNGTDALNSVETGVSDLTFQRIGNTNGKPTVKINFTLTSKTIQAKGAEIRNYQTTAGLR
jgi:type II secretory pathway pseudopilin PulG